MSWSSCHNPALKFSDTKDHLRTLLHVFNFSVSSLSVRVHFNFIFHFDVMTATSACSVICQFHSDKLERKVWIKFLIQFVCWIISMMWCIKTTQILHSNLFISPVLTFSVNSVKYRNISQYALCHDVSWYNRIGTHVSWCISYLEVLPNTQPYCLPL